jgi:glycerol uptake operon antiterminator
VAAIFILGGTIFELKDMVARAHDGNKYAFLHIDLTEGLGRDDAAVEWCVRELKVDGVNSTRPALIRRAAELGVVTIQRLFLMDSSSFEHGKKLLRATPPEMAEVLPGIAPKAVRQLCAALDKPVIAGGMISEKSEIIEALEAGAIAVSVSDERLWAL